MSPLLNSLVIALASTALACLLGVLAAFALAGLAGSRRLATILLAGSVLPILVPNYILVSFWMEALGAQGWLARLIADGRAVPVNGLAPTVLTLGLIYWSPVALVCWFTLSRMDRAMIEAAELALGKRHARWRVILPWLTPSVAITAVVVFLLAFSNFSVPAIYQVRTIQNEIYIQFNANFDTGKALWAALPQVVAAIALLGIVSRLLRKRPWIAVAARPSGAAALLRNADASTGPRFTEARLQRLLAFGFLVVLLGFSAIGPVLRSVAAAVQGRILWQTLSVSAVPIWNSFWFASVTATLVTGLALFAMNVGGASERRPSDGGARVGALRRLPHFLFVILFVLPEILIGIALIAIFNRPSLQWIYTSVAIVLIAFTVRYCIVGRLAVSIGRSHVDPSLLEAAQLAGLSRRSLLFRIQLPLLGRWLFAGWWLTYLFCLADIGSLVLIYPPGCDTVPIRIFNLLHYGYEAQISALCLVMLALGALPLVVMQLLPRLRTIPGAA